MGRLRSRTILIAQPAQYSDWWMVCALSGSLPSTKSILIGIGGSCLLSRQADDKPYEPYLHDSERHSPCGQIPGAREYEPQTEGASAGDYLAERIEDYAREKGDSIQNCSVEFEDTYGDARGQASI